MRELSLLKGFLIDLDGVLYTGANALAGAVEAVEKLRTNYCCRFVTNTSTLSLAALAQKINALGFVIPAKEIISAPQAAVQYLKDQQNPVCRLLLAPDVKQDFAVFNQASNQLSLTANYIVIGDIGDTWSYNLSNQVFNDLMQGAKLIAIHKNKFWQTEQGLQMDIGGFVEALEYASGVKALIIGKPSANFFKIALADMDLNACEVAMIGDDIDVDIGGSQQIGISGILVKTGKYRQNYADACLVRPDLIIDSIADLPQILGL